MAYLTDGSHKFKGPSGVMMYKATIRLAKDKKKLYAMRVQGSMVSTAQDDVDFYLGKGKAEVISVEPAGRNPDFPGVAPMTEWEDQVKLGKEKGKMTKWLKEKEKEVMHGDEIARGAVAGRTAPERRAVAKGRKG